VVSQCLQTLSTNGFSSVAIASNSVRSLKNVFSAPTDLRIRLARTGRSSMHDDVDDDSPERDELRALDKLLCWRLLKLPAHTVSPLDPMLDGEMPEYMAHLPSGRGWDLSKQWRCALQAMLDAQRRP
jgi:hypothetical protein